MMEPTADHFPLETSMRFHLTAAERRQPPPAPPVMEFTAESIAAGTGR
jgi:hypothetical protein